jgi:hypothetical protein
MSVLSNTIWEPRTEEMACLQSDIAFERSIGLCTLDQKRHYLTWHRANPELTFADMCEIEEEHRQADGYTEWEEYMADCEWQRNEDARRVKRQEQSQKDFEACIADLPSSEQADYRAWRDRSPHMSFEDMRQVERSLRTIDAEFEAELAPFTERERQHFLAWRKREPFTTLHEMLWIQPRIVSGDILMSNEVTAHEVWESLAFLDSEQEPELVEKSAARTRSRGETPPNEWDLLAAEIATILH